MQHNNVFQQKPAFNVSVKESLSILPYRLALTGIRIAPPGSAEDVRYSAPSPDRAIPKGVQSSAECQMPQGLGQKSALRFHDKPFRLCLEALTIA
jgi:hypothetical protein